MRYTLRNTACLLGFVLFALSPLPAVAQEYPAREIRSICNFAAGSGADILVRYYSDRSEEHTSELQSLTNIVCRLLLEKKKTERIMESAATNLIIDQRL